MEDESPSPLTTPVISPKPCWEENPLTILDIIDQNDVVELQLKSYEFWEKVYHNIEILERALFRCIENRNMRILEHVVNRLPRPDDEVCARVFTQFKSNKWMAGYNFLINAW